MASATNQEQGCKDVKGSLFCFTFDVKTFRLMMNVDILIFHDILALLGKKQIES